MKIGSFYYFTVLYGSKEEEKVNQTRTKMNVVDRFSCSSIESLSRNNKHLRKYKKHTNWAMQLIVD